MVGRLAHVIWQDKRQEDYRKNTWYLLVIFYE